MLLAEQRLAAGALAPARRGTTLLGAKPSRTARHRRLPVEKVRAEVGLLGLADRAAADLLAPLQALTVKGAERTAAVLA
jgi:hypothetical protein